MRTKPKWQKPDTEDGQGAFVAQQARCVRLRATGKEPCGACLLCVREMREMVERQTKTLDRYAAIEDALIQLHLDGKLIERQGTSDKCILCPSRVPIREDFPGYMHDVRCPMRHVDEHRRRIAKWGVGGG